MNSTALPDRTSIFFPFETWRKKRIEKLLNQGKNGAWLGVRVIELHRVPGFWRVDFFRRHGYEETWLQDMLEAVFQGFETHKHHLLRKFYMETPSCRLSESKEWLAFKEEGGNQLEASIGVVC